MHRLITALITAAVLAGCASTTSTSDATLTGTVSSTAEFSLPPTARLNLVLAKRIPTGGADLTIASTTIPISGTFPFAFELPYPKNDLPPETDAVLLAQITVHGATWFSNVLTPASLDQNTSIDVPVRLDGAMR